MYGLIEDGEQILRGTPRRGGRKLKLQDAGSKVRTLTEKTICMSQRQEIGYRWSVQREQYV